MIVIVSAIPLDERKPIPEDNRGIELVLAIGNIHRYHSGGKAVFIKGKTVSSTIWDGTLTRELDSDENRICDWENPSVLLRAAVGLEDKPRYLAKFYYIGNNPQKGVEIYRRIRDSNVQKREERSERVKNPLNENEWL